MLPKNVRLPMREAVGKNARRALSSQSFLLKIFESRTGHNRFGVIVSARAAAKSATRHLLKRRLLAGVREWPNMRKDFLFIVSPKAKDMPRESLRRELEAGRDYARSLPR